MTRILTRVSCTNHFIILANFDNYIKGKIFRDQLTDILGRGIFVSDQDAWRFHRKTAANIFTTKLYRQLVEGAFHDTGLDLCSVLEKDRLAQRPVDLQELFLKLTLDAFGKLTFGLEFNALTCEGPNEFGDAFDYLTANVDTRVSNPFWFITDWILPGKMTKLRNAIGVLDKFASMAIEKRKGESVEEKEKRPKDLLDHFINHVADDGSKLTNVELRDVFVNFMIAGRDTTAQALTWQFYSLMTNPRVMNNLVHEIDVVLQGSQAYTYEIMTHGLPYLKAVFHETLRLYPPVPKNVKTVVDDDVLPGGVRVYKGDVIGISSWCLARNKEVWGEDAEQFVPERWLVYPSADSTSNMSRDANSTADKTNLSPFGKFRMESPYKFTSFNAGPRLCLGQTFATLEALVTTTLLLQKYEFGLVPGQQPAVVKGSVTLPMAYPLMTKVTSRVRA
ncbi:cytochrome P450 [Gamsiella multidivaricata]|uniref:cytochrome P450 n=1 Tax=Gamsiella multidivaricata TaxID=101098 RepID=UPI00221EB291|nr:cytochrome P450 [Gamsiella multidivaricata]KAI7818162.1 cytochrome P450 [Gamsiella multidivaricata]